MKYSQDTLTSINDCVGSYFKEIDSKKYLSAVSNNTVENITCNMLLLLKLYPEYPQSVVYINKYFNLILANKSLVTNSYCFFLGRLRIVFTLLKLFSVLKEDQYLTAAKHFLNTDRILDYLRSPYVHNGLVNGKAGLILGLNVCHAHLSNNNFEGIRNETLNRIFQDISPSQTGISNCDSESAENHRCDMRQGSAGMIWLLSEFFEDPQSKTYLKKVLKYLVARINKDWDVSNSCWRASIKNITTYSQQKAYIIKLKKRQIAFFKESEIDHAFWTGTSGIIVSLTSYLKHIKKNHKQKSFIVNKIFAAEERIWQSITSRSNPKDLKSFFYTYLVLYKFFKKKKYLEKAHYISNLKVNAKDKLAMLLCIHNKYDLEWLNVLPSVTWVHSVSEIHTTDLPKFIIQNKYPKTSVLIGNSLPLFFPNSNFLRYPLSEYFFYYFEKSTKEQISKPSTLEFQAIRDCFKYEILKRKINTKYQNKIFLKTLEILQKQRSAKLFANPFNKLQKNKFQIPPTVSLHNFLWDWVTDDHGKPLSNLEANSGNHIVALQAKSNPKSQGEYLLTESQVILIEKFYSPTSIEDAIRRFSEEFTISSAMDVEKLDHFTENAIEYFVFNGLIMESNIVELLYL